MLLAELTDSIAVSSAISWVHPGEVTSLYRDDKYDYIIICNHILLEKNTKLLKTPLKLLLRNTGLLCDLIILIQYSNSTL